MLEPSLALEQADGDGGIFVRNYIDQSQEFVLCTVVLAFPIVTLLRDGIIRQALLLTAVAVNFILYMAFVIVSRTALVTAPIMLVVFAMAHLRWRTNVVLFVTVIVLGAIAWAISPQLQATTERFTTEYRSYKESNQPTSIGLRLEYWEKSLRFFTDRPIIGHGTGSTLRLFEAAATGPEALAQGRVIGNPHNQTLNCAFLAVSRRGAGGLDRTDGGVAERVQFPVQLASIRFS
jgi:O-antigen ligase